MSIKKLPLIAATAMLAGLVTACTSFAPVYGDRPASGAQDIRFNFAAPDSRFEQIILDRLKLAFPGEAGPDDPVLDLVASTDHPPRSISNAYPVARPINVRGQATVTIKQGKQVLFEATRFADSAYQSGKLTPVDLASAQGAQENVAEGVAESLRAAVLAGYRPGP
jgi:hypothetical protein